MTAARAVGSVGPGEGRVGFGLGRNYDPNSNPSPRPHPHHLTLTPAHPGRHDRIPNSPWLVQRSSEYGGKLYYG